MRKLLVFPVLLLISQAVFALSLEDISAADAAGGLREALLQGSGNAVSILGRANGYLNNPKVKVPQRLVVYELKITL